MGFFSSGSAAVDAMGRIEISGNITPPKWFKEILRDNGKPYLLAIILLSDIVYWYRPVEVRDEATGNAIGWRKKFKSDYLQKTYEQYADQYGETKRTIKAALDRLEELGLIRKIFRNITLANGTKIPNVMYIAINPEGIERISHEKIDLGTSGPTVQKSGKSERNEADKNVDNSPQLAGNQDFVGYPTKFCTTPYEKKYDLPQKKVPCPTEESTTILQNNVGYPPQDCETNTENILENTKESTSDITTEITQGEYGQVKSCHTQDAGAGVDNQDEDWMDHIDWSKPIQVKIQDRRTDKEIYTEMLRDQVEYDILMQDSNFRRDKETIDGIINIITDIATTEPMDGYEVVNKRKYPHEVVKSRLLKIDYSTLTHVLERLRQNTTEIRSLRNYLITALYNARDEMDFSVDSQVRHDMYGGGWEEKGII